MSDSDKFRLQRVKALKYLCINHRDQGFLKFYVIRLSVSSFCFNTYVIGLRLLLFFNYFSSESDV